MEKPKVKHITATCLYCDNRAFVQVLVVDDKDIQKKIDRKARYKLKTALHNAHRDGYHD